MKLSLCIATYNEEKNIHYPLDSAYDFVDEVIIVDGGSTDKTVEKAKSYGKKVKVITAPNPPMFHINKQKAIDAARGEWILQLDADEALSKELKEELKSVINSLNQLKSEKTKADFNRFQPISTDCVAYWLPRKNFFLSRFLMKGGQYPDYTIRLYKRGTVKFPLKSVHENVELISNVKAQMSNQAQNSKSNHDHKTMKQFNNEAIGFLKFPILHFADPDFSRYLKRWDRYTTLDAEILSKKLHVTSYMLHILLFLDYFIFKPTITFFSMYFRHLGFKDGFPGFVFALFSALRFWVIYIKYYQKTKTTEN